MLKHFLFIMTLFCLELRADTSVINQFDQRQYSPAKYGLKDLVFKVKVKGLEQELKQRFALTQMQDPHFVVYWMSPGRTAIEVQGLPAGFEALKNELKKIVLEKFEYVIPQEMSGRLRSYEFQQSRGPAGETLLKGTDRTQTHMINQIHLTFGQDARLEIVKTFSPRGAETTSFETATKPWSHSKRVVEKVVHESTTGVRKNKVETKISYTNKDGYGLPEKIITESTFVIPGESKDESVSSNSALTFTAYQVNAGVAQKYFASMDAP